MTREAHILIYAEYQLHAQAWEALLGDEPFLVVDGRTTRMTDLLEWQPKDSGWAVLVDIVEPAAAAARWMRERLPEIGSLFLVDTYDLGTVFPLIEAGAGGCLIREAGAADLARAHGGGTRGTRFAR
jgi:DNA-binding NarL/FixJ family response regulator